VLSRRALWLLAVSGFAWSGCYGTLASDEDENVGGSSSGSGGKSAGGSQNIAGRGGKGSGGSGTAGMPSAGGGGEPGQAGAPSGGAGGGAGTGTVPNPSSCDVPYAGPVAGPRTSGPEPINLPCASITDEVILARYNDEAAKVPQGSFWEPPPGAIWAEPCSDSLAQTEANAQAAGLGTIEAGYPTEWFYEATTCDGSQRRFYRNLRCDYFDGTNLANGSGETLAFLASLLWWQDNFNITGHQLLGYTVQVGNATDWVEVCTIRTVYGDFGLCDEITLESTSHSTVIPGMVTLGEPQVVRTIQGECH
jgi:hypothetical protein